MARLFADENFNYSAVLELRNFGHDVLTTQEAGQRGYNDATILANATAYGRAVLTHNRFHFVRLHRQSKNHAGIIVCTDDPNAAALARRIDASIQAGGSLVGQLLRVDRPSAP